nr:unnamed protein product [Digitaria exilis]
MAAVGRWWRRREANGIPPLRVGSSHGLSAPARNPRRQPMEAAHVSRDSWPPDRPDGRPRSEAGHVGRDSWPPDRPGGRLRS